MKRSKQQKKVTDFESIEGESHAAMLKRLKRHLATIRAEKEKERACALCGANGLHGNFDMALRLSGRQGGC